MTFSYQSPVKQPLSHSFTHSYPIQVEGSEEVLVESSANVFVENLLTSRQFETTYYVTDAKQQTDFFWFRQSGVRVNIGIQNPHIVPVYDDVDHGGHDDNEFVVGNPSNKDNIEKYRNIVRRHCR